MFNSSRASHSPQQMVETKNRATRRADSYKGPKTQLEQNASVTVFTTSTLQGDECANEKEDLKKKLGPAENLFFLVALNWLQR